MPRLPPVNVDEIVVSATDYENSCTAWNVFANDFPEEGHHLAVLMITPCSKGVAFCRVGLVESRLGALRLSGDGDKLCL